MGKCEEKIKIEKIWEVPNEGIPLKKGRQIQTLTFYAKLMKFSE